MRYNPTTDQARGIDEIAAECKAAITGIPTEAIGRTDCDLLHSYTACLKSRHPRQFFAHLEAMAALRVAEAMGNFAEMRRLRACVISGLY